MNFKGNQLASDGTEFWKLWVQHQDYLYQRCLRWMSGNSTDAQEILSQASIKAWEKWQDYAGKITNPRAWLTRLIHNLCIDMHREWGREATGVENIEEIAIAEDKYFASSIPSPELAILADERNMYLHHTINALPAKVRIPLLLRYEQELSYSEIAQQLTLPQEKVRKRVHQGRTILKKQLNEYFSELDSSSPSATCSNPPLNKGVRSSSVENVHFGGNKAEGSPHEKIFSSPGYESRFFPAPLLGGVGGGFCSPPGRGWGWVLLPSWDGLGVGSAPYLQVTEQKAESETSAGEKQFSDEFRKLSEEKLLSGPITTSGCNTLITAGCTPESIDYKVTATCLEILSPTSYSLPSCLGWR